MLRFENLTLPRYATRTQSLRCLHLSEAFHVKQHSLNALLSELSDTILDFYFTSFHLPCLSL